MYVHIRGLENLSTLMSLSLIETCVGYYSGPTLLISLSDLNSQFHDANVLDVSSTTHLDLSLSPSISELNSDTDCSQVLIHCLHFSHIGDNLYYLICHVHLSVPLSSLCVHAYSIL